MAPASYSTERLQLNPTTEADAPLILAIMSTPKFHQFVGDRGLRNEADAAAYIQTKMLPQISEKGYGNYCLIRKEDGVPVGMCGLYDRPGLEHTDLGFGLLPEHEGQGYTYEAAHRLLEAARADFGLTRIQAITAMDHQASQRVLVVCQALGFEFNPCIVDLHLPIDSRAVWCSHRRPSWRFVYVTLRGLRYVYLSEAASLSLTHTQC